MVEGPGRGEVFTVDGEARIGRSRSCEIRLLGRHISRVHAKIEKKQDALYVSDAESRNGIFVNGKKATDYKLQPDDEIEVGEFILVFDPTFDYSNEIPEKRPHMTARIQETLRDPFSGNPGETQPGPELDRMRAVLDTIRLVYSLTDEKASMKALLEKILAQISVKRGFIMLTGEGGKLTPAAKIAPGGMGEFHVSNMFHHRVSRINEGLLGSDLGRYGPQAGQTIHILCVPLVAKEDRYLGFLYLDGPAEETIFRKHDLRFCMLLATFVANLLARNRSRPPVPENLHSTAPASTPGTGEAPFAEIWSGREKLPDYLQKVERACLEEALKKMKGNRDLAAELVGITSEEFAKRLEDSPPASAWKSVQT